MISRKLRMMFVQYAAMLFALLLFSNSSAHSELPDGVVVSISVSKNSFSLSDKLLVKVSYHNLGDNPVRLLKWNTALEGGITEDLFLIEYLGEELEYIGVHAKRLAPRESDYIELAAGEIVSGTIDLLLSYPINYKGDYRVSVRNSGQLSRKTLEGLTLNLSADRPIVPFRRTPNFQNCSASQASSANSALTVAERIAVRAARDLRNTPVDQRVNARRYLEWFGAPNSARYAIVQRSMDRIASALSNQTIGFNCNCTGVPGINPANTFAFVFKNDPFNMTLCDVFFRVPRDGTDSKSGTIVHEVSHFTVVGNTDDFNSALNQSGSRNLARSSPPSAIRNANAYEYFAENTPFLSMPQPRSPDLVISSSRVLGRESIINQTVRLSGSIRNRGDGVSSSTSLSLNLSEVSSQLIAQTSIPSINPGANIGFQIDFQAPSVAGEYTVRLCLAPIAGESNTANNCSLLTLILSEQARPVVAPIIPLLLDD